jgi:hypothetical protein
VPSVQLVPLTTHPQHEPLLHLPVFGPVGHSTPSFAAVSRPQPPPEQVGAAQSVPVQVLQLEVPPLPQWLTSFV